MGIAKHIQGRYEMKKLRLLVYAFIVGFLTLQFCITSGLITEEIQFITSYWNTTDYDSGIGLDDWNEAGGINFIFSGYKGKLYVKNDNLNLYLGILILGEPNGSMTWRVNFDIDADGYWAEDVKELGIVENGGGGYQLEIDDQRYLQGDPTPYSDSKSDDFTAVLRIFDYLGDNYTIFELTIPLQSDDLLNDLQVSNPEESIIGISLDVFHNGLGINGTWKGNSYPNFADSLNYAQIIFAGPQDRQIPIFEEEPPLTTTTTTEEATWAPEGAAGDEFGMWICLLGLGCASYIIQRRRRR
ncbi:hypothetical protein CEE45_12985 [Candidatus Heimdallarchaeota archaeon B3_Heim]|nr:MAG: hypothetical protein CEE45_12985 [Candidatus Heimdallarchaeota archaeon B3_Heim]